MISLLFSSFVYRDGTRDGGEWISLENKLLHMFDYQKFSGNRRLKAMIRDAEANLSNELSEDDLDHVFAAGDVDQEALEKLKTKWNK